MGKFALVTGGGGSVGRGLCLAFAAAGYDIAILGRTESKLVGTAREVARLHPARRVVSSVVDVRDTERMEHAINEAIAQLGQLAIFVHAAAVHHWCTINRSNSADIDEELDVNLRAGMHATRIVAPHMMANNEGAIIFITSWLTQQLGWPGTGVYLTSKFGLHGFGRAVFEDLRNHNVKCSTICPGFIESDGMGKDFATQFGDYVSLQPQQMLAVCTQLSSSHLDLMQSITIV